MKKTLSLFLLPILLVVTLACQLSVGLPNTTGNSAGQQITQVATTEVQPVQITTITRSPSSNIVLQQSDDRLVELYNQVSPGVVAIQVTDQQGGGLGSGFVVDKSGYIVTNYHVVEGADGIEVDFPSGYKSHGKVIGTDLDSDLAVIKVDVPADVLVPLALGNSDQVQVGQTVIAIGNPFGYNGTMTTGIVSAKGRTLESIHQAPSGGVYEAGDIIQTDAAINPGNSGGPLLNLNGEVIGVNRAIQTDTTSVTGQPVNSGIGFAVSIDIVKRVLPALIQNGSYDYPYLGITALEELSLTEQETLGIKSFTGAYVVEVARGGPADQAGIVGGSRDSSILNLPAGGDLITAVDDHPVRVFGDVLSYIINNKNPGDKITLKILRNNVEKEVILTLGKRP
jgi:S1-C subfamily serine protease